MLQIFNNLYTCYKFQPKCLVNFLCNIKSPRTTKKHKYTHTNTKIYTKPSHTHTQLNANPETVPTKIRKPKKVPFRKICTSLFMRFN